MPSQDRQGRKLLHIASIVANLPITGVEGHYRNFPGAAHCLKVRGALAIWDRGTRTVLCAVHPALPPAVRYAADVCSCVPRARGRCGTEFAREDRETMGTCTPSAAMHGPRA